MVETQWGRDSNARVRWAIVLVVAMVLAVALCLHLPHLNGPWYWKWPWRRIDTLRIVPAMLCAAAPFFIAQVFYQRGRLGRRGALFLLALSTFLLELVAIGIQGPGFDLRRIAFVVQHPVITSYFSDALALRDVVGLLGEYPQRMETFHLHSINKPPGPILYYASFLSLLAPMKAAMAAGLVVGLLAAVAVPATFGLVRRLGAGREAAFHAASYMALCPGLVLFFPEFDQAYPLLTCGLVASFSLALERGTVGFAIAFGALLSLTAFMSFGLLVLGAFLAGQGVVYAIRHPAGGVQRFFSSAAMALGTVFILYAGLYLLTGYNPVETLGTAVANEARHSQTLGRPWPATVLFDLLDFALGTGWISFLMVGFWLARRWGARPVLESDWMVLLAVGQVLLVASAALIPTETARVWLFLVPLWMLPVGLELAHWPPAARASVYVALWGLLVLVGQNLVFLGA